MTIYASKPLGHPRSGRAGPLSHSAPMPAGWFKYLLAICVVPILNLDSLSQNQLSRSAVTATFLLLLCKNLLVLPAISLQYQRLNQHILKELFSARNAAFMAFLAIVTLTLIAEIRGVYTGVRPAFSSIGLLVWISAIFMFVYTEYSSITSREQREKYIGAIFIGVGVYVLLNIIGHFAGLRSHSFEVSPGPNKTLSYFGIGMDRVVFPFGGGLNNFSIMAGLGFIGAAVSAYRLRGFAWRFASSLAATASLLAIVLVDSRAIYLSVFLASVGALFWAKGRIGKTAVFIFVLALAAMPFVSLLLFELLNQTDLASILGREGRFAQQLGIASGRDVIWGSVGKMMLEGNPIHVVGYGVLGQIASGANKFYAWIFQDTFGQAANSLHNVTLQVWIDTGYVGLIVWLTFQYKVLAVYARRSAERLEGFGVVQVSVLLFVFLSGLTEVTGTIYINSYTLVLVMCAIAISDGSKDDRDSSQIRLRTNVSA